MNSVLFITAAPNSSATPKATPPRASSDTSTSPEDPSGFAGVLANQAAPQQKNSTTPTAGHGAVSDTPRHTRNGAATETSAAPQRDQHIDVTDNQDAAKAASLSRLSDPKSGLAGLHTHDSENGAAIQRHRGTLNMAHDAAANATLPERFSQVIAAMSKIKGSAITDAHDGKNNGLNNLTAPSDASKRLVAPGTKTDGHDPLQNNRTRTAQSDRQLQAHTARDVSRANAGTDARTPGTFTIGMPSIGAEPISFSLADSQRGQAENSSLHTLHSVTPVSDTPVNSHMTPVTGFGLIPGAPASGDIMITSAAINQPLHSPHWAPELGRQFISVIRPGENGNHSAELRLDPPELGPLRITININDSVVQALFTSAHSSVRSAVEHALPLLQQQLEQEGLSLGQASVDHDDGRSDSHAQHGGTAVTGSRDEATITAATSPARQRAPDALVDTFV